MKHSGLIAWIIYIVTLVGGGAYLQAGLTHIANDQAAIQSTQNDLKQRQDRLATDQAQVAAALKTTKALDESACIALETHVNILTNFVGALHETSSKLAKTPKFYEQDKDIWFDASTADAVTIQKLIDAPRIPGCSRYTTPAAKLAK